MKKVRAGAVASGFKSPAMGVPPLPLRVCVSFQGEWQGLT